MGIAKGLAALAVVLLVSGSIGAVGPWAVSAGSILVLLGGIVAAVAEEDQDHIDGLLLARRARLQPTGTSGTLTSGAEATASAANPPDAA